MTSMTKHIPVCKNTTGNCEQDAEEVSSVSEGEVETVGKPTGTYWKNTRQTECLGCYRNCNGKENDGKNSTKYMGTSPMTPVIREV